MAASICNVSPIPYYPFFISHRRDAGAFYFVLYEKTADEIRKNFHAFPMAQYGTNYKQNIKFWQCLLVIYTEKFFMA